MSEEAISKDKQLAPDEVLPKQEPSKEDVEDEGSATRDIKVAEKDVGDSKKPDGPTPGSPAGLSDDDKEKEGVPEDSSVDKGSSCLEESNLLSDLKDFEKKALLDLRSKIEDAILNNRLFKEEKEPEVEAEKARSPKKDEEVDEKGKSVADEGQGEEKKPEEFSEGERKEEEKKPEEFLVGEGKEEENKPEQSSVEEGKEEEKKLEEFSVGEGKEEEKKPEKSSVEEGKEEENKSEQSSVEEGKEEEKKPEEFSVGEGKEEEKKPEKSSVEEGKEVENKTEQLSAAEGQNEEKQQKPEEVGYNGEENEAKKKQEEEGEGEREGIKEEDRKEKGIEVDKDIKLWGVALLPSKGDKGTDVILLKFLRAREFKAQEAFDMLRNTLKWRKDNNIDSILKEDFPAELSSVAYMQGMDRQGHPICYNIFGTFLNDDIYNKFFVNEELRQKFFRWRFQLMERGIKKLDFGAGGATSLLQVNDLKNSPGPTKKEVRQCLKQAVALLQDNYPEFVARNIFLNVPFWSYAFYAFVSPFFTQRSKSKLDFARPAKVTELLLKYIAVQEIPVEYGGFNRQDDTDFTIEDGVSEVLVKGSSSETIEIPAPAVGTTFKWEITVLGWEVSYKEEFVPTDERSYTMIVQKGRKMGWQEGSHRNSFTNKEPGKVVLTIDNPTYKKKKILYRHKSNSNFSSSST